jgi:hypothetical protein
VTAAVPEPATPLDTVELTRRLREAEAERDRVTAQLQRLESSTALQLARVLAAGARNPRRGIVDVPRETASLLRRRRSRRAGVAPQPARTSAAASPPVRQGPATAGDRATSAGADLGSRLLAASALLVLPRDRPVLAVVAGPSLGRAWADAALVQVLRPDDATAVLAAVGPDVLVVSAAAGRAGPWAGFGSYEVPERDLTVRELLLAARDRNVPAVLVAAEHGQDLPMITDVRSLFAGEVPEGATVGDVLAAAGRVAA